MDGWEETSVINLQLNKPKSLVNYLTERFSKSMQELDDEYEEEELNG